MLREFCKETSSRDTDGMKNWKVGRRIAVYILILISRAENPLKHVYASSRVASRGQSDIPGRVFVKQTEVAPRQLVAIGLCVTSLLPI